MTGDHKLMRFLTAYESPVCRNCIPGMLFPMASIAWNRLERTTVGNQEKIVRIPVERSLHIFFSFWLTFKRSCSSSQLASSRWKSQTSLSQGITLKMWGTFGRTHDFWQLRKRGDLFPLLQTKAQGKKERPLSDWEEPGDGRLSRNNLYNLWRDHETARSSHWFSGNWWSSPFQEERNRSLTVDA